MQTVRIFLAKILISFMHFYMTKRRFLLGKELFDVVNLKGMLSIGRENTVGIYKLFGILAHLWSQNVTARHSLLRQQELLRFRTWPKSYRIQKDIVYGVPMASSQSEFCWSVVNTAVLSQKKRSACTCSILPKRLRQHT